MQAIPAGLYALTPDEQDTALLCEMVKAALMGGVSILQYRNKSASPRLRNQQAQALLNICRQYQVPLIINDDVKLCLALDADGVHIGKTDGEISAIRQRIGADKILGVSCYNQFENAVKAHAAGADYVAFGACFASNTKPNAVSAPLSLFAQARKLGMTSVGIGGININNAEQVIGAGANAIALINALFDSRSVDTITQCAKQFCLLFSKDEDHDLKKSNSV